MRLVFSLFLILLSFEAFAQQATLVSTAIIRSGTLAPVNEYIGTVQYEAVSTLASEISGRVDSINAQEGDRIKKGDALITLNKDTLNHNITATAAAVEQQKAALEKARRDFQRAQALFDQNAIAEQRYLDAETEYQMQQRSYDATLAQLNVLREDLKNSTITAPFDGVVIARHVNVGEWTSPGTPVVDIASLQMEILVNIPQSVITNIKEGLDVDVMVEGNFLKGKVKSVIPQANVLQRTFPVKIDIPNTIGIFGGMDCTVRMPVAEPVDTLIVPRDAIVLRDNRDYVFIVEDGKALQIPVTVTGYVGTEAGVKAEALQAGTGVVTRGNEQLANGQNVSVAL